MRAALLVLVQHGCVTASTAVPEGAFTSSEKERYKKQAAAQTLYAASLPGILAQLRSAALGVRGRLASAGRSRSRR